MTSHIFLSLGMWDDVIKANETAMTVVNRSREKMGKGPAWCGHINEWLEYGYLQQGRVADARRVLEGCRQIAEKAAGAAADPKSPAHAAMSGLMMSGMTPAMMLVGSYAEMRAQFLIIPWQRLLLTTPMRSQPFGAETWPARAKLQRAWRAKGSVPSPG
jgi:hypothetical protein